MARDNWSKHQVVVIRVNASRWLLWVGDGGDSIWCQDPWQIITFYASGDHWGHSMSVWEFKSVRGWLCESISVWAYGCLRVWVRKIVWVCETLSMLEYMYVSVSMYVWVCVSGSICECVWVCTYEYQSKYCERVWECESISVWEFECVRVWVCESRCVRVCVWEYVFGSMCV
jgi:hypothetical protein